MIQVLVGAIKAERSARSLVEWIRKPDTPVAVEHQIVGNVQPLALKSIGQYRRWLTLFVGHNPPGPAFTRVDSMLAIHSQAIRVIRAFLEDGQGAIDRVESHDSAGLNLCVEQ